MIPEIGHFALILALVMALIQGVSPWLGGRSPQGVSLQGVSARAAGAQFLMLTVAFGCLTWAFIDRDFSVLYVAQNAHSDLPLLYRISAVWGAHEGSLLLWAFILAGWTVAVAHFSRPLGPAFSARVMGVMGLLSVGFLLFILGTSNPFERLIPAALEGRDLNPLLQDPGLILHPPMLYMGYVGMAVPFAFAMAALMEGRLDAAWVRWTRPWTTVAWVFLTLGIALGSWWAYYELGWGGWWFWDPVENASLMPWLVATALIHSLAVTEKRNAFVSWTVLLAICGFSLSLLGTFLVRSGVLVSVHAFAADPSRGVFILLFLAVVVGSALGLFTWRAQGLRGGGREGGLRGESQGEGGFSLLSRETFLLINNVLLVVACATVLLGTLYPLLAEVLGLGKYSVGPPYFNRVFVPLMLPLALILGIGPLLPWRRAKAGAVLGRLKVGLLVAVGVGGLLWWRGLPLLSAVGVAVAVLITTSALDLLVRHLARWERGGHFRVAALAGMTLAHLGVAVFVVGVTLASTLSVEEDVRMAPGEDKILAGHRFVFQGVTQVPGPNYLAERGEIRVYWGEEGEGGEVPVAVLRPEKRIYPGRGRQPMTEAAIHPGLFRDIYVALGESLGGGSGAAHEDLDKDPRNDPWAVRLYYKPFVRWIWLGPLLMALGGLIATLDGRYRILRRMLRQ